MALGRPLRKDLHCADQAAAASFNCSLSADTCLNCAADDSAGTVTCHCRDADMEGLIEDPSARLPLTTAKIHLRNRGTTIWAEVPYAPVQVHVKIEGLELSTEIRDTKCFVEPANLTGCFRCLAGARFESLCRTEFGDALASVDCDMGLTFALHCSQNGTRQVTTIPVDRAELESQCTVQCPAGITAFQLQGTLAYVPLREQFGYRQRTASTLEMGNQGSWWPDLGLGIGLTILRMMGSPQTILILGLALFIGGVALYCVVRLNPIYRAYRLAMTMPAVLLALLFVSGPPLCAAELGLNGEPKWERRAELHPVRAVIEGEPDSGMEELRGGKWPLFIAFFGISGLLCAALIMCGFQGMRLIIEQRRLRRVRAVQPLLPEGPGVRAVFYTIPLVILSGALIEAKECPKRGEEDLTKR